MRWFNCVFALVTVALAAIAAPGLAPAQESQSRFAFVVGNDAYDGAPLATAANDAALVADALKVARFDVTGARNLDQDTLRASYREFLAKVTAAGPGAVSVIYLSGYGLQFDGENYVVPPGAAIARDSDVSLNAIRLSDLIRPLSSAPGRARIVLLDLAYASPYAKQIPGAPPGLAIIEPDPGTIVSFNAAPGAWAAPGKEPYGPYAQALSEMLREPGLPIEEVLVRVRTRTAELTKAAQVPWSAGKIEPPLVLLERAADAPAPIQESAQIAAERARPVDKMPEALAYSAVIDRDTVKGYEEFVASFPHGPYTKNVQGLLAARREARTWRRTLDRNTQNAYWSYLKRYPRGPHAAEARRRLTRLQAALEPPPSFEPIDYDDPPPPPVEEAYFEGPDIVYYDDSVPPLPPSIFVAAPPPWYQPPPPPVFDEDDDFFLPQVVAAVSAPVWIAPPPYVLPPPQPIMMDAAVQSPGWRPYVAIPVAVAAGLAAGKLSNRLLENRRQSAIQNRGPQAGGLRRQAVIPPISSLPKGMNLPAGVRPGLPIVRPAAAPAGQQLVRPPQPGQPALAPGQPAGIGRPGNALPNLPAGQPGQRPGQIGRPGSPASGTPLVQPGTRPAQPTTGSPLTGQPAIGGRPNALPGLPAGQQGARPGAVGQPLGTPSAGTPTTQPGARHGQPGVGTGQLGQPPLGARPTGVPGTPAGQSGAKQGVGAPTTQPARTQGRPTGPVGQTIDRRQQLIQQQQQRQLQLQQRQQQSQQQRAQQQQLRQQQLQEQRARQMQQQERVRQQQSIQQQRVMQQQRQQQMLQLQRSQQQMLQQQRMQQQQRQQQMIQQQRQQLMQQQQRQQQQIIQQQRQQQQRPQQQRQQRPPCGLPGLPRC